MERRQILHSCCQGLRHHNSRKDAVASIQISDPFTPVRPQQPESLRCQPCIASKPPTPFSQAPMPRFLSLCRRESLHCGTHHLRLALQHAMQMAHLEATSSHSSIRLLSWATRRQCTIPAAQGARSAARSSSARHHSASSLSSAFYQHQRKPWIPLPPHHLAVVEEAAVESLRCPSWSTLFGLLHNRVLKASTAPFPVDGAV